MKRRRWSLAIVFGALGWSSAAWACPDLARAPDSRWRIDWQGDVAWLETPCGERFFSTGVNVLDGGFFSSPPAVRAYRFSDYDPSLAAWADRTRGRLAGWGFNSAGGFSLSPAMLRMPSLPNLELGRTARFHWFDSFSPATEREVRRLAVELTAPHRGNPHRIGYTADNEVGWWSGALFNFYAKAAPDNVTKRRLVAFLERFYAGDWNHFSRDFLPPSGATTFGALLASREPVRLRAGGEGIQAVRHWTGVVTDHYYKLMSEALRAADPEALFFGDRLPIYYDPMAVRSMARHVDAIAANYNLDAPDGWVSPYFFAGLRALAPERPVVASEWFFAARENRSGNRNTGHLMTVATQAERARGAAAGARQLAQIPNIIGIHWFQFHDYPVGGRADREDYNFGLVDITDRPYEALIEQLGGANRSLASLHAVARGPDTSVGARVPYAVIDARDGHLGEWPKRESWRPGVVAGSGEIPFGDFYVSWSEQGLALAVIAMDYFDPDLLAPGPVPNSEVLQVHWGIDAGAGVRRLVLKMVPPTSLPQQGAANFAIRFCAQEGERCEAVPGAVATYFGADQPRITAELTIPWAALGVERAPEVLKLYAGARAYHRSRWMAWGGGAPGTAFDRPQRWPTVTLAR